MLRHHQKLTLAGTVHFVSTVTRIRGNVFRDEKICRGILELFEGYRKRERLDCLGYVLMPDHLHVLLRQAEDGDGVIKCMTDFKKMSSLRFKHPLGLPHGIWAAGYDDVAVPGLDAVRTKLRYILFNPVKRGLVDHPENYVWSSARNHLGRVSGPVCLVILDSLGGICDH
jgi:putative transposase